MIRATVDGQVGHLVLDRPEKLNALTAEMIDALRAGVRNLIEAGVSVILVESSGRHFCAGADLAEWASPDAASADRMSRAGVDAFAELAAAPMPTIAVIDGVAAGGGLELALACDVRLATVDAKLGLPETRLGNLPAYGGVQRLVQLIGTAHARELLFTAQLIDGVRAAAIGLVNHVVSREELPALVERIVLSIVSADARSVALAKALTGGAPLDGLLASFTSQTAESRARKAEFLAKRAAAKGRQSQGASS